MASWCFRWEGGEEEGAVVGVCMCVYVCWGEGEGEVDEEGRVWGGMQGSGPELHISHVVLTLTTLACFEHTSPSLPKPTHMLHCLMCNPHPHTPHPHTFACRSVTTWVLWLHALPPLVLMAVQPCCHALWGGLAAH